MIALILPALRVVRIARLFKALSRLRGLQLMRVLASVNRGMKTLGSTMQRRGFGYVMALTVIITFAGAAGIYFFERGVPGANGITDFWSALWWTAMVITTMGSEYWPKTPEGRTLCLFLALYAFSVFSYFAGTIATYFIGRDAADKKADIVGRKDVDAIRQEIAELRKLLLEMPNRVEDKA